MRVIFYLFFMLLSLGVCSQLSETYNYQAILRDEEGNSLTNTTAFMLFSIRANTANSPVIYQELQILDSDENGLITAAIGSGEAQYGVWSEIDWECCPYFLSITADIGNGNISLGTDRLRSVPFATVSQDARNSWKLDGNTGTIAGQHYIGTRDLEDLVFKTFNRNRMTINTFGQIGIGIAEPMFQVHIHDSLSSIFNGIQITNTITGSDMYNGLVLEVDDFGYSRISSNYGGYLTITNSNVSLVMDGAHAGLGTTQPQKRLHLSDTDYQFRISSSSDENFWNFGASADNWGIGPNKFIIHNLEQSGGAPFTINGTTDFVGIEDTSPSYNLEVNGSAAKPGGGSWTAPSDIRLKQNISEYQDGLNEVLQIRPVRYQYTSKTDYNTDQVHIGVIAQELQKIAPYMVSETEMEFNDGRKEHYLDVDNSAMIYMLINAVQEQQQMIKSLQEENVQLREEQAKAFELLQSIDK